MPYTVTGFPQAPGGRGLTLFSQVLLLTLVASPTCPDNGHTAMFLQLPSGALGLESGFKETETVQLLGCLQGAEGSQLRVTFFSVDRPVGTGLACKSVPPGHPKAASAHVAVSSRRQRRTLGGYFPSGSMLTSSRVSADPQRCLPVASVAEGPRGRPEGRAAACSPPTQTQMSRARPGGRRTGGRRPASHSPGS